MCIHCLIKYPQNILLTSILQKNNYPRAHGLEIAEVGSEPCSPDLLTLSWAILASSASLHPKMQELQSYQVNITWPWKQPHLLSSNGELCPFIPTPLYPGCTPFCRAVPLNPEHLPSECCRPLPTASTGAPLNPSRVEAPPTSVSEPHLVRTARGGRIDVQRTR